MNGTNRFANRFLLLITGLVTLLVGATSLALATSSTVPAKWDGAAADVLATIEGRMQASPATAGGPSWILVGVLALLVLAVVLLVVFVLRHGGGRTDRLYEGGTASGGRTIIDTAVASDILDEALSHCPELLSVRVSARTVRRTPVLDVAVACRRGVSPRVASDLVGTALRDLDALIGIRVPALVQLGGGLRTRLTAPQRLGNPAPDGTAPSHSPILDTERETPSWDSSASSSSA